MGNEVEPPVYTWKRLEKLDAAISWRRDAENAPLANVWHLETVAELATALKALLEQRDLDEQLISLLWDHVPGDDRLEIAAVIEAPGSTYPHGAERLGYVVDPARKANPKR
jgi:hypothetical protein